MFDLKEIYTAIGILTAVLFIVLIMFRKTTPLRKNRRVSGTKLIYRGSLADCMNKTK